jgi:quinolinate synthase
VIVTSTNAKKIVEQIPKDKKILFAPDRNLGGWLKKQTGRDMELWQGACIVHEVFAEKKVMELKAKHPDALVIAHPECEESVLKHADFVGSTSQLLKFSKENAAKKFIVATEPGILHPMQRESPDKTFIPAPGSGNCQCSECPYMKLNSLEKLYVCLRDLKPEILIPEETRVKALKPIEKMLEMSA